MICAWNELLSILPIWMRETVSKHGYSEMQEIRLRVNSPPELVKNNSVEWLTRTVSTSDIAYCINAASRYSPWTAESSAMGYITAPGGHRIGICGQAILKNGELCGFREITSLCIRIAKDISGIWPHLEAYKSIIIIGAPGWGKTTLLRDCVRHISENKTVSVIDERGELFPNGFQRGKRMDIFTGCPKKTAIETVLRTMGPEFIAVDEITAFADCEAMLRAAGCGVHLIATAHASSIEDFSKRPAYRPLLDASLFDHIVILRKDKSYIIERASI